MLDLTKALESVDREMAWQILLSRYAPLKLVALIKDLHTHHSAARLTLPQLAQVLDSSKDVCLLHPCSVSPKP